MADIQTTQIKVTLPPELYGFLKNKAQKFGLSLAGYIRHLVINDVKDLDIPVVKMTAHQKRVSQEAYEDYKAGRTKEITDLDKYLNDL